MNDYQGLPAFQASISDINVVDCRPRSLFDFIFVQEGQLLLDVYNDFSGNFQTVLCSWIYRSYAGRSLFSNLTLSPPAGSQLFLSARFVAHLPMLVFVSAGEFKWLHLLCYTYSDRESPRRERSDVYLSRVLCKLNVVKFLLWSEISQREGVALGFFVCLWGFFEARLML